MAGDSVAYLREAGLRVFFDAEHFFDGYRRDANFALRVLATAEEAGAEVLVLCDTNGGTLPDEVSRIVADVRSHSSVTIGGHSTTTAVARWRTRWKPCAKVRPMFRAASTATANARETQTFRRSSRI